MKKYNIRLTNQTWH